MVTTRTILGLLLACLCSTQFPTNGSVFANEETSESEMTLDRLPKTVRKAVELAAKDAEIEKIELEVEDGQANYEITIEVEGGTVELCFNADGKLIGIEVLKAEEDDEDEGEDGDDDDEDEGEDEEDEDSDEMAAEHEEDESSGDEESSEPIEIKDLPASVRKAIKKASGEAKEFECQKITKGDVSVFEAAWFDGDIKMEVTVSGSGDVLSNEKSLTVDQLPKALRRMATEFAGKDDLKLEAKSLLLYELEVVRDGQIVELYVDATGRTVKVSSGSQDIGDNDADEDDDDEDDDDEDDDDEDEDEDEDDDDDDA